MAGSQRTPRAASRPRRTTYYYRRRDEQGLRLVAEMTFMPVDLLSQWLAPNLSPPTDPPENEPLPKLKHGGKRDDRGWPTDRKKRLHTTLQLAGGRWDKKMHYAETWKPWDGEVTWVRINEAGLRNLGLDWPEIPWPEEHKRLLMSSHCYHVNQRRLSLARGLYQAPAHVWKSERELYIEQIRSMNQAERAHRPDGILTLTADGAFDGPTKRDGRIEQIPLFTGQTIAIEEENTQKGGERLGKGILPSLLRTYDFAWYFCRTEGIYDALVAARRDHLNSNEERRRIRILRIEEQATS